MRRSNLIQIATGTWIVLREYPQHPKAVIHRIIDTSNEPRYMVMTWDAVPASRRMVGLHDTLEAAEQSVPWPPKDPVVPLHPHASQAEWEANASARDVDGSGYPPGHKKP